jgi:hypothetical protein
VGFGIGSEDIFDEGVVGGGDGGQEEACEEAGEEFHGESSL